MNKIQVAAAASIFASVLTAAFAQTAMAQANTAENGVSWTIAPSMAFQGSSINTIDLNSYSGHWSGGSVMTLGAGDAAGHISFTGSSHSRISTLLGERIVSAMGGETRIDFATQQQFFGMNWGTLDTSNVLSFYNGSELVYSLTGAQAIASTQSLYTGSSWDAGFSFADAGFTRVVLAETTSGKGFEIGGMTYSAEAVAVAPIPLNAASMGGLMSFPMLSMWGKGGARRMLRMAFASITPRRSGLA